VAVKEKEERARVSSPAPLFPKEKEKRERVKEKATLKERPAVTVDASIDALRLMIFLSTQKSEALARASASY